jgi:hypothetical protein
MCEFTIAPFKPSVVMPRSSSRTARCGSCGAITVKPANRSG